MVSFEPPFSLSSSRPLRGHWSWGCTDLQLQVDMMLGAWRELDDSIAMPARRIVRIVNAVIGRRRGR